MKKVIYIAGPITGVPRYWEAFEAAEDELIALDYIPLSPAHMPSGLENEKAMRICLAMIDAADAVLFLPGSSRSRGASLEHRYCEYTGKPWARGINELEEALKNGS
jgi:nucleoside 2-deoxyribosyltransferase|nr:MAG TPA: 2'-deoxynucleoside 5'-phosphate N-hydrolase 1 [Bacteriophage sp.]